MSDVEPSQILGVYALTIKASRGRELWRAAVPGLGIRFAAATSNDAAHLLLEKFAAHMEVAIDNVELELQISAWRPAYTAAGFKGHAVAYAGDPRNWRMPTERQLGAPHRFTWRSRLLEVPNPDPSLEPISVMICTNRGQHRSARLGVMHGRLVSQNTEFSSQTGRGIPTMVPVGWPIGVDITPRDIDNETPLEFRCARCRPRPRLSRDSLITVRDKLIEAGNVRRDRRYGPVPYVEIDVSYLTRGG